MMEQSWVPVIAAGPDQVGPAGPAGPQGPAGGPPGPQGDPAKAYVGDSPPPPESSFVLWVDTSDESAVPGSPSLTIKGIGNLLTLDQANVVGGGWYGLKGTYDTTTDGGVTVGRFTVTGANGQRDAFNLLTPMPFDAGVTRTVTISIKPSATRTVRFAADGWDAGWTNRDVLAYVEVSCPAGVWTEIPITTVTGAARSHVGFVVSVLSAQTDDVILAKRASVHNGAGGKWQRPGVPVPGQSRIAVNGAVDLSGAGSPEGVITAAPGSTWLQTDATTDYRGFMVWRKNSGTGNTGWGVETGDTGIRAVTTMGANYTGTFWVRREGQTVVCSFIATATGAGGYDALFTVPSGFRHSQQRIYGACKNTTADKSVVVQADSATNNVIVQATVAANDVLVGTLTWHATVTTWPASLPGTAD